MKASFAVALAIAMSIGTIPCRAVAATAPPALPPLPPGGRYVSTGEQLQVQGQTMDGWMFEAPGDVREIAQWFSRHKPILRDLLVAPGLVILSGSDGTSHWAARMTDGGDGWTHGTLSRLSLEHAAPSSSAVPWQPAGARLHFNVRWREARQHGSQQVWSHAAPPAELRSRLRAALQRDGWLASDSDAVLSARWVKAAAQLSIVVVAQNSGSGIVTLLDWLE